MGYKRFQPPGAGAESEFAATVLSVPAPDSLVPETDVDPCGLPPADGPEPSDAAAEQQPTLSHIGRYALKQQLGQGGLGTVYEAWDPLLSRTVAVKTLQFDVDTPSRVSLDGLFLNEARTAAGLNHPYIVTIFDAGLTAQGVYIAMERLRGRDLRQALAQGWRPTPAAAAQLVRRVAEALAYAHARGVVHCDVKPANIFLTRRGKPRVLDFGIARAAHGSSRSVLDGLVAGSPHYLAPEQMAAGDVDARTDVYALGVVLYELLAGRKAFDGSSLEALGAAVMQGAAPPLATLCPDVAPELCAIAERAMARQPAERYPNAQDMAQALRRWQDAQADAEPAAAAPVAPAAAGVQRRTWIAAAGALLLSGAGLLWVTASQPGPVPSEAPAIAVAPAAAPAPVASPVAAVAPPAADAAASATPEAPPATLDAPAVRPARAAAPRPRATAPARALAATPAAAVASGSVQLAISPWGEVEVDGQAAGTTPPLTRLTLAEGAHTVTVRNEDFAPYTLTVQVSADAPVTVRHRFGAGP